MRIFIISGLFVFGILNVLAGRGAFDIEVRNKRYARAVILIALGLLVGILMPIGG